MTQPQSIGQLLAQAFALLESSRSAEARRLARRLEDARPEPPGLAYLLGLLALDEGQGRKAAQHLARAIKQSPASPPLLAMARAQTLQSRWSEAETTYRRLLTVDPVNAAGWRELSELRLRQAGFDKAALSLRAAVRLLPAQAGLHNNLGIAERATGRLDAAERSFLTAMLLEPGTAKAYANLAGLLRHRRQESRPAARRAVQLDPTNPANRLELGQALTDQGDDATALSVFAVACEALPGQAEPLWLYAECLRRLGRESEAADSYRRLLAIDPQDSFGAGLALAQLGQAAAPERASDAHIRALYDQYAGSFDQDLLTRLDYRGPAILADALRRAGIGGPCDIFDAGCGTGLMGVAIKPLVRRLDGADLSAKMAEQARARGIYHSVDIGDLLEILRQRPSDYDLILAADVLIYQGDLHPFAAAAFSALRPDGTVAFTVERTDFDSYNLQPTGRFAHSEAHLRAAALSQGFVVTLLESIATRRERGEPVPGLLSLWKKP